MSQLEAASAPPTATVLGDAVNAFAITGMRYEYEEPGGLDWITVDLSGYRFGEQFTASDAFLYADDLPRFAEWMDDLAARAESSTGAPGHKDPRPSLGFDEPTEFEAREWGNGKVRLAIRWYGGTGPWPQHEASRGSDVLILDTDAMQLRAFADDVRHFADMLPPRERDDEGVAWPIWLFGAAVVTILALAAIGAVTAVRWLAALAG